MSTNSLQLLLALLLALAGAHPFLLACVIVAVAIASMLVRPVFGLLAERERRTTRDHVFGSAPEKSVVIQTPRRWGRTATQVWVGDGGSARSRTVVHVHHVVVHHHLEPQGVDGRHDPR